jgi:hypothetical protein
MIDPSECPPPVPPLDVTTLPQKMDEIFLALDDDAALCPTKIKMSDVWSLETQKGLLAKPTTEVNHV